MKITFRCVRLLFSFPHFPHFSIRSGGIFNRGQSRAKICSHHSPWQGWLLTGAGGRGQQQDISGGFFALVHLLRLTPVVEWQRCSWELIARAQWWVVPQGRFPEAPHAIRKTRHIGIYSTSGWRVSASLSKLNSVIRKDLLQFPNEFNCLFSKVPKEGKNWSEELSIICLLMRFPTYWLSFQKRLQVFKRLWFFVMNQSFQSEKIYLQWRNSFLPTYFFFKETSLLCL